MPKSGSWKRSPAHAEKLQARYFGRCRLHADAFRLHESQRIYGRTFLQPAVAQSVETRCRNSAKRNPRSTCSGPNWRQQKAIVLQEIQEAFIRANTAARLVEIYRDTLRPQAQATLRAASAAYQTDQTDFLNLIDSQNTALDVEYSYYRALAEFDSRVAELEGIIGAAIPRESVARAGGQP